MSKATPADLESEGFHASQLGTPANFTVYLQTVLDDVALEVAAEVGATSYAASGDVTAKRVRQAEIYLAAAALWRRIEVFERRNARKAGQDSGGETIGSRALENASQMEALGRTEIAKVTGRNPEGGIASSVVESGPYTSTQ